MVTFCGWRRVDCVTVSESCSIKALTDVWVSITTVIVLDVWIVTMMEGV